MRLSDNVLTHSGSCFFFLLPTGKLHAQTSAKEEHDKEMTEQAVKATMPTSLGKFKGHTLYCLEIHLHQNEMLHPKGRSAGITLKLPN